MFHNQNSERDKNTIVKYKKSYKEWLKNNKKTTRGKKGYIDKRFLHYITCEFIDSNKTKYAQEFSELLDLMIRKTLTSHKYINYDKDQKHEMYSNAIFRIFKYALHNFKRELDVFNYFSNVIVNSFLEIIKNKNKTTKIAFKCLKQQRINSVVDNCDETNTTFLEQEINDVIDNNINIRTGVNMEDLNSSNIEKSNEFYNNIKEKYGNFSHGRFIEDEKSLLYNRKFIEYDTIITLENGEKIVVEYIDVKLCNECTGISNRYLSNRAIVARRNGLQYFGVFSDEWNEGKEDKEIGLNIDRRHLIIMKRLDKLVSHTLLQQSESQGKDLQFDYIVKKDLTDDNITEPYHYVLDGDRTQRRLMLEQEIEDYMTYLESADNPTRIYGYGRLINI